MRESYVVVVQLPTYSANVFDLHYCITVYMCYSDKHLAREHVPNLCRTHSPEQISL